MATLREHLAKVAYLLCEGADAVLGRGACVREAQNVKAHHVARRSRENSLNAAEVSQRAVGRWRARRHRKRLRVRSVASASSARSARLAHRARHVHAQRAANYPSSSTVM